jgi:hypothetical protein
MLKELSTTYDFNAEEFADEPSDLDQDNPVNMSNEAWREFYAEHPEAWDYASDY